METKILDCSPEGVSEASRLLKQGCVVAVPTETVYGLAADALNRVAVAEIFNIKGRPQDNPLIVHVSSIDMWKSLVKQLPDKALALAEAFWPGPLTIILEKGSHIPDETTAGLDTVAVRMPNHSCFLGIINEAGIPMAAPSANLSGSPSPTCAKHCEDDLKGKVPLIIDGGECSVGIESTVLALIDKPTVLRPGAITPAMISKVLGEEVYISDSLNKLIKDGPVQSPGMKYKHYSPKAKITLANGSREKYFDFVNSLDEGIHCLVFDGEEKLTNHPCVAYGGLHDLNEQSKKLFAALRKLDETGAATVYARCPDINEESMGVYNRLLCAAAFEVLDL